MYNPKQGDIVNFFNSFEKPHKGGFGSTGKN